MPKGRKKGEKIGKVTYKIVAVRLQGKSAKVVGEKEQKTKPSFVPKSPARVAAGKAKKSPFIFSNFDKVAESERKRLNPGGVKGKASTFKKKKSK